MTSEQALREEIEHLKAERDASIKRAQAAEDERDALSTHASVLESIINGSSLTDSPHVMSALNSAPTTSLARLKAQWCEDKAAHFLTLASSARENGYMAQGDAVEDMAQELKDEAAVLRRQAEDDQ